MKTNSFHIGFGLALLTFACSAYAADRPNILMIAVDDLRPELGCYGVNRVISPNIDRLAAEGTVFNRAYVQQAVCGPSRTSILSGLRPNSTGILNNNTMIRDARPDITTLPQHFKAHGYHTVSLGKIYHHDRDDPDGWSEPVWRPFGISYGWRNYRHPDNRALIRELHAGYDERKRANFPLGRVKGPAYEAMDLPDNVYPDGLVADTAVHAIQRLTEHHRPFFLAVGFYKPHLPFACPQKYWDLYDPADIELPDNDRWPTGAPQIANPDSKELRQYHGIAQEGRLSDDEARKMIHGYLACVSYMDAQVGRVMGQLAASGQADNTVVVLWGDHGWHLREQGLWAKQTNFELGARAPLIVRAPGKKPGQSTDALVELVDLYPSLCELAGLPAPSHLEGTSFAPLLEEPKRKWKSAAFSQFQRPYTNKPLYMGISMRTERYRFIRWTGLEPPHKLHAMALFDHWNDPNETKNIAGQADPKLIERLTDQINAGWQAARP
jgi:choline-sulfatase